MPLLVWPQSVSHFSKYLLNGCPIKNIYIQVTLKRLTRLHIYVFMHFVLVILDFQLDYICIKWKPKWLGTLTCVGLFLKSLEVNKQMPCTDACVFVCVCNCMYLCMIVHMQMCMYVYSSIQLCLCGYICRHIWKAVQALNWLIITVNGATYEPHVD